MQFLHRVKHLIQIFAAIALCAVHPRVSFAENDVVQFAAADPAMSAAVSEATQTLPRFLIHAFGSDTRAVDTALLKVAFPKTSGQGDEVIWVDALVRHTDGTFTGHLANQPHYLDGHYMGSAVDFTLEDIRDWGFTDTRSGLMYGHYTTRVVIQNVPAETRARILALLADPPLPIHW